MLKKIFYLLAVALAFAACATDAPTDDTGGGKVGFVLHASRANTGQYVADAADCELLKSYRVAITTASPSRRIIKCIDKVLDSPVELDPMDEIKLSPGIYNVFAFANIDFDYLDDIGIWEGGEVPADIRTRTYSVPHYFDATGSDATGYDGQLVSTDAFAAAGHYIPMTSLAPQVIEVTSRVNQTFNIEVRRLFAKLEFVFTNDTERDLQVNALSVGNMTFNATSAGSIPLMNLEEERDALPPLSLTVPATLSHTFTTPSVVSNAAGTKVSHSFYVLESRSHEVNNAFPLTFNVTPKGQSASAGEDIRYAITDPATITLIHRNDWIVIPVKLIDWQMRLEVSHYPPIGGYPMANITENDEHDFIVTFDGPGDFVIAPYVRRYFEGAEWFPMSDRTKVVGAPVITVDVPGYFPSGKAPRFTKSGEIIGTMRTLPGQSCCITVSLDVKVSDDPLLTRTLTRKIYIHQK